MTTGAAQSEQTGLRLIAAFEALKGVLIIAVGIGLLTLLHKDLQAFGENIIKHLHLNPAGYYSRIFLAAVMRLDNGKLEFLAVFAFLDAVLRFVQAYGLWQMRAWAEWLAIISGSIYLPIEIYEIFQRPTFVRAAIFAVNLLIVAYLVRVRLRKMKSAGAPVSEVSR